MRGNARSSSTASRVSGTRCSRPAFIRAAGTIHSALSRSTSAQVMPRTSPERATVIARNWSARAAMPSRFARSAHQRGASASDRAGVIGRLGDLARLRQKLGQVAAPPGRVVARAMPRHRRPGQHGLDAPAQPARGLRLVAPDRLEHAQHVAHLDLRDRLRRREPARRRCRASSATAFGACQFLNSASLCSRYRSTACPKVGRHAPCASRRAGRRHPREPLVRRGLLARLGEGDERRLPGPSSRRLPRMVTRCTQKRAPFGSTRRYRPSPPPSWTCPALSRPNQCRSQHLLSPSRLSCGISLPPFLPLRMSFRHMVRSSHFFRREYAGGGRGVTPPPPGRG